MEMDKMKKRREITITMILMRNLTLPKKSLLFLIKKKKLEINIQLIDFKYTNWTFHVKYFFIKLI